MNSLPLPFMMIWYGLQEFKEKLYPRNNGILNLQLMRKSIAQLLCPNINSFIAAYDYCFSFRFIQCMDTSCWLTTCSCLTLISCSFKCSDCARGVQRLNVNLYNVFKSITLHLSNMVLRHFNFHLEWYLSMFNDHCGTK